MTPPNDLELSAAERIRQLAAARQRAMALPADQTMQAIFEHPQPPALVHSFAEEDLYFLIHDIGLENALPLIALASNRQWEYFLDMEIWSRDRLNVPRSTAWLHLLLRADRNRLVRWCFDEKLEFLELYLFRNIEVRVRESDQSPADFGDGFFTDDDTYYVRFVDYPTATQEEAAAKALRNEMLGQLLRRLSIYDHPRYQGMLMEATAVIPGEIEEELFRLRNVRLGEKGFLPFDEAIGVYQPLGPGDLEARSRRVLHLQSQDDSRLPVPLFTENFLEGDDLFVRSLKSIAETAVVQQLQTELASLCNQVISADQVVIQSREQLQSVVAKVSGYLSIGLERIAASVRHHPERDASAAIRRYMLADIFRTGFACALELKWQAGRWYRASWCHNQKVDLTFWGEKWLGQLGGLLIERPQFYDPKQPDSNYRDFKTLQEVTLTERGLLQIQALDRVFGQRKVAITSLSHHAGLNYKNLLLTQWARGCLEAPPVDPETSDPAISLVDFKRFYDSLWRSEKGGRIIGDDRKTDFLHWIANASECSPEELSDRLGWVFEALFNELQEELAEVTADNLDPRHIHLFLLKA